MNPINYSILIQRVSLISCGFLFLIIILVTNYFDPYKDNYIIWWFLLLAMLFLVSIFNLLQFWWVFGVQKNILNIFQINSLIYHSFVLACTSLTILILNQTQQLNFVNSLVLIVLYISYWSFARS